MSSPKWLIVIRLASDPDKEPIFGMEWRLKDYGGILPNEDELRPLKIQAKEQFHKHFYVNAWRASVEYLPWLPSDGTALPDWREGWREGLSSPVILNEPPWQKKEKENA